MEGYWFRTTRFQVIAGEDNDTGPGIYGRELAHWLRDGLVAAGYPRAEARPESWGWCILVAEHPRLLWVGCGGLVTEQAPPDDAMEASPESEAGFDINQEAVLWHCHASVERSWLPHWWRRHATDTALMDLDTTLRGLLLAEPRIQLVDPQ